MWMLYLNDMRSSNIETLTAVARAEDKETLENLLISEKVESYSDGRWGKSFRKGGPLEWFNKPWTIDEEEGRVIVKILPLEDILHREHLALDLHIREEYKHEVESVPLIDSLNIQLTEKG